MEKPLAAAFLMINPGRIAHRAPAMPVRGIARVGEAALEKKEAIHAGHR
ncbi:MAG: hypothetical protein ING02_17950 [Roseomonas sp.]|nr:hypothetical protein [Roseomonas sp.]